MTTSCINDEWECVTHNYRQYAPRLPAKGDVFKVLEIRLDTEIEAPALRLAEIPESLPLRNGRKGKMWFIHTHFRKVKKTDISVFTEILEKAPDAGTIYRTPVPEVVR